MIETILSSAVTFGLGPAFVLVVGYVLNHKQEHRTESVKQAAHQTATEVKEALQETTRSNTTDHGDVVNAIARLETEMKAHRQEFKAYTTTHAREHQLINQIITTR